MRKKVLSPIFVVLTLLFFPGYIYCQCRLTKPASASNINMALGNPTNATADTLNANNYLMVKSQYSLSYNNTKHIPNWVSWHVGKTDLDTFSRQNNFRPDKTLPRSWYKVTPADYSKTGFDKGHQCPSGDRTNSKTNNSATFLMSNMIPQAPNNNRQTWEQLEAYSRSLIQAGNEIYIICGIYGQGGVGSSGNDTVRTLKHGVVVPAKTWKIIVVLPEGGNDISRITTSTRVISVIMPNTQSCSKLSWGKYRVSVDSIQKITGYDFLSNVPADIQKVIEAKVDDGPTK